VTDSYSVTREWSSVRSWLMAQGDPRVYEAYQDALDHLVATHVMGLREGLEIGVRAEGHVWKLEADGSIDEFYLDTEYEFGPGCTRCRYCFPLSSTWTDGSDKDVRNPAHHPPCVVTPDRYTRSVMYLDKLLRQVSDSADMVALTWRRREGRAEPPGPGAGWTARVMDRMWGPGHDATDPESLPLAVCLAALAARGVGLPDPELIALRAQETPA
jgi:hypothetical protein